MLYRINHSENELNLSDIFDLFDKYNKLNIEKRIAVFDFDNTLLHGDIGEAVFASLKKNKFIKNFTWCDYNELIKEGKTSYAYKRLIAAYDGLTEEIILYHTKEVFNTNSDDPEYLSFLENGKFISVLKPSVNKIMSDIILKLQTLDFKIYVISASSEISVKYLASEYFGLDSDYVFGMKNGRKISNKKEYLTDKIEEPAPCFEGKAKLYKNIISDNPPIITAGDSKNDIAFMNLTDKSGIKFWIQKLEDDDKSYHKSWEKCKNEFDDISNVYFIKNVHNF